MWDILDRYPRAYLWSVLLHLALLVLMLVGVDWRMRSQNVGALENVIAARMTPSPELARKVAELAAAAPPLPAPERPESRPTPADQAAAELARQQAAAEAEQARQNELAQQQAAEAERARQAEQARQQAAAAERARQAEQVRQAEQARQRALEEQRQVEARRRAEEETRRRVAAEAARRAAEAEQQRVAAEERRRQAAEAERQAREAQARQEADERAAREAQAQALEAERQAQRAAEARARQAAAAAAQQEAEARRAAEMQRRAEELAERERELQAALADELEQARARQAAENRPNLPVTGAEADAATRAAIANRWVPAIQSKVRQVWVRPAGTDANLSTVVSLQLNPGGDVVIGSVKVREGSGNAAFDQSVISAVYNASPLPVPDGAEFALFADFDLRFRP